MILRCKAANPRISFMRNGAARMYCIISSEEQPGEVWLSRLKNVKICVTKWWNSSRCNLFSGGLSVAGSGLLGLPGGVIEEG
jgi:hypothetical protein